MFDTYPGKFPPPPRGQKRSPSMHVRWVVSNDPGEGGEHVFVAGLTKAGTSLALSKWHQLPFAVLLVTCGMRFDHSVLSWLIITCRVPYVSFCSKGCTSQFWPKRIKSMAAKPICFRKAA